MTALTPALYSKGRQAGATLLVAIVMLLVITLLALSSMRGVTLESRITGNLKQQRNLTSAAEAGLRIGEKSVTDWQCSPTSTFKPCMTTFTATTNIDTQAIFNVANLNYINKVASGYSDNVVKIQWYVLQLGLLGRQTMGNCALMASSVSCSSRKAYYEVTVCASTVLCSDDSVTQRVILRSIVAVSG